MKYDCGLPDCEAIEPHDHIIFTGDLLGPPPTIHWEHPIYDQAREKISSLETRVKALEARNPTCALCGDPFDAGTVHACASSIPIGSDNLCLCTAADPCPLGKIGSQSRCTKNELQSAGFHTCPTQKKYGDACENPNQTPEPPANSQEGDACEGKLRDCPFCNGIKLIPILIPYKDPLDVWVIRCYKCSTEGPRADSKIEAIKLWNRR